MKDFLPALKWIISILEEENIEYQVVGGFAALLHGGTRSVVDLDFYVSRSSVEKLVNRTKEYITKDMSHYVDESWDISFMKIHFADQQIEFGEVEGAKIYDPNQEKWLVQEIDFSKSIIKQFGDLQIKVMPVEELD